MENCRTAANRLRSHAYAAGLPEPDFECPQVLAQSNSRGHRDRTWGRKRAAQHLCTRQRSGIQHEVRRQTLRCISTSASHRGVRGYRRRACHGAAHRAKARRSRLGRSRSGQGSDFLLHPRPRHGEDGWAKRGRIGMTTTMKNTADLHGLAPINLHGSSVGVGENPGQGLGFLVREKNS